MGKTIGRIALVAAAIAVNVIPGVGQAISAAIGATLASAAISAVTLAAIATAAQVAGGLLGLGPKAPPPDTTVTTVKSPTPLRQRMRGRRRMYGSKIFFETNAQGITGDVYAFLEGRADGVEQVYLNDDKVTIAGDVVQTLPDKRYQNGRVRANFRLGETPNVAFSRIIALFPGIWTENHRGDGVVTGYLTKEPEKERDFITTYPQGDNVELSAVFRGGADVYDPRTDTRGFTENPVLHLMDYLIEERGYDYATRFLPTIDYWITAANVCDEAIPLKGGGTEPRYRSCVAYSASAKPKEVIASYLETFDGWYAPRGDRALVIYAGKLYEPTVSLGGDEILSYNLPYGVSGEDGIDQLTVSYISEAHDWSVVETTAWGVDGPRVEPFSPQTPSFSQNRRLAKRFYARQNEAERGTITTNLAGRVARGHRYIYLTIEESGMTFFEGVVEVKSVRRDFASGGLAIEWVAIDPNIDDWNPATEEGEPAALGERVAPEPLETPMILMATQGMDAIILDVEGPELDGLTWYARYRVQGATLWGGEQQYTDIDDTADVELAVTGVPAGEDMEFQVAYQSSDGRLSDWSPIFDYTTEADDIIFDGNG